MACFRIRSSAAAVVVVTMLLLQAYSEGSQMYSMSASSSPQQRQHQFRKMLGVNASSMSSSGGGGGRSAEPLELEDCSTELLEVSQNNAPSMAGGMPTYSVEIANTCIDCLVCDVHVACGDFASNDVVDPDKFRRLGFNDCLVNGGRSIEPSFPVSFQYGNSFPYPMTVASASCDCK